MAERKMPSAEDFPSNANGIITTEVPDRDAPEKLAVRRKRSGIFRDVKDEFMSEDAGSVGSYILYDILIPSLRDLVLDILHGSIDMALGGGGSRRYGRSSRNSRDRSYISYDRYYYDDDDYDRRRRRRDRDDYDRSARRRADRDLTEFDFRTKEKAEDVLDFLCDEIDRCGEVPVSRFYDRIGETVPGDFTADDWGWRNLSGAKVRGSNRMGWYIDFPRIRAL